LISLKQRAVPYLSKFSQYVHLLLVSCIKCILCCIKIDLRFSDQLFLFFDDDLDFGKVCCKLGLAKLLRWSELERCPLSIFAVLLNLRGSAQATLDRASR
jgi:hypothetical protein